MSKLLASDIDGTLLLNRKIHHKSIENIDRFKNDGNLFILSTGRALCELDSIINEYKLDVDAYVLCNGAFILDKSLNIIEDFKIDSDIVYKISKYVLSTNNFTLSVLDGYKSYLIKSKNILKARNLFNLNSLKKIYKMLINKSSNLELLNLNHLKDNDLNINIMSIYSLNDNVEKAENLKNHLNDEFGEYITAYRNKYFVDVVFKGCSKATGIEKVCKNFNLADNNVYVIGDSWNDLSMFERYDNSYTFTYAEKTLQKKANKVIDSFHYCIDDILS
ncbi:MAG: HAD-IIB family hydrolase [Paeniclostridium sordellii]|uniref:HAD-IIB family hydrolase n=1 Tax=Paeniclostridium hominis TaxID=2764329 RepID=A0ABR7K1W2_9FIRM|nr:MULTISPECIES: HAD-IIB family hydrolase [Paeniclostridium]MBC6003099.1 HAD-IIB family hydrolase [Paeniclostridium hominis]MDU1538177.1 HAD-IIB family hydrolase [Paeniclostridium sordellii]